MTNCFDCHSVPVRIDPYDPDKVAVCSVCYDQRCETRTRLARLFGLDHLPLGTELPYWNMALDIVRRPPPKRYIFEERFEASGEVIS